MLMATCIQLRLADGSRMATRFQLSQVQDVGSVAGFCQAASWGI